MKKIINASVLSAKTFACHAFGGQWAEKIGSPERGFKGLFYGPPKSGKSVEVLRFADYFAGGFGKVLYNSCEEKLGKTLQDTVREFGIRAPRLYFADGLDFAEMCAATKKNRYRLVIIDSVQYMSFSVAEYKEFARLFPRVALVLISQVNNRNEPFGGKNFLHMVDFYAQIIDGTATYSTRYNKDGKKRFTLYESPKKQLSIFQNTP